MLHLLVATTALSLSTILPPAASNAGRSDIARMSAPLPASAQGCKYGQKEYWDSMYRGSGAATLDGLPADAFSWYCGWEELQPFWEELVPDQKAHVLIPGVGNDATLLGLYDAGWQDLTAFDYSAHAVARAKDLVGTRRRIALVCVPKRRALCDASPRAAHTRHWL